MTNTTSSSNQTTSSSNQTTTRSIPAMPSFHTRDALAAAMYTAMVSVANKIAEMDAQYGELAQRKVKVLSAHTDLQTLIRYGKDLDLIATKIGLL